MKLNINKLKNMPSKNKIMLGVGISLLVVALISTTYFVFNSKKAINTKKIEISEEQTEDIEKVQKEEESAEKELEEAEEKVAKVKEKVEAVKVAQSSSSAKTSTSTASTGRSNNTTTKAQEQPKEKKKVLVKEAWSETIKVPVTKYRPTWWVRVRGSSERKIFYSENEQIKFVKGGNNVSQWGDGEDEAYTVYEDKVINHPAEYKWE